MKGIIVASLAGLLSGIAGPALPAQETVTLDVPGMSCPLCPITVRKALEKVPGVSRVDVSLEKKEAVVTFDDTRTAPAVLREATRDAGYPSTVRHDRR